MAAATTPWIVTLNDYAPDGDEDFAFHIFKTEEEARHFCDVLGKDDEVKMLGCKAVDFTDANEYLEYRTGHAPPRFEPPASQASQNSRGWVSYLDTSEPPAPAEPPAQKT